MPKPSYTTARELNEIIDAYFKHIDCSYHQAEKPATKVDEQISTSKKAKARETEPATIAGLALFLGFNSKKAFDDYKRKGKFANALKRGCLRVEAGYEKKLHDSSSTGAVFALKSMGWKGTDEGSETENKLVKSLKIQIVDTGPKPVENEKEVVL